MKIRSLIVLWVLLSIPIIVTSQENKDSILRLTMKQAIEYATVNSYSVKGAKYDIESAKKKVWETTAIGLPQVKLSAQYQNIFKAPTLAFPATYYDNVSLSEQNPSVVLRDGSVVSMGPGIAAPLAEKENITVDLTVTQLIFSGEYIVGLQASKTYKQLSEQALNKSITDIKEGVTNAYCLVLITAENIKIVESSLSSIINIASDIEKMKNQGFVEETEYDQMIITKSNLENSLFALQRQNEVAFNLLKLQLGLDFSQTLVLEDSIPSLIENGNKSYLENSTFELDRNINYQLILTQEKLNLLSLRREKSKFLPTIAAFYRHQELAKEPEINFNPPNVIGVSIEFPLFTSGQRLAQVSQARISYDKSRMNREQAGKGLMIEFQQAHNDYASALKSYNISKQNLELSKKIYDRTLVKYKQGMSSSLELNQNQGQFLQMQTNYFLAVMDLFNKMSKLEKLLTTVQ